MMRFPFVSLLIGMLLWLSLIPAFAGNFSSFQANGQLSVVLDGVSNNFATFNIFNGTQGPYWTNFNLHSLSGSDPFTATITNFPATYPNNTRFNWSFTTLENGGHVWGYPEIVFGTQGGGNFSGGPPNKPTAKQLGSIGTLSVTYNITRGFAQDDSSFLIETWSQTTPNNTSTITHEILFYAFPITDVVNQILSFTTHFNYSAGGVNIYVGLNSANGAIFMMPVTTSGGTTPLDMSSGTQTINFASIFAALISNGYVSGTDFISGYEFGFEIARNTGAVLVNQLTWTWL